MTDIASEFRYRQLLMTKGGLSIFVSQSGETMDTLSLRYAAAHYQRIVSVVNSPESSIARGNTRCSKHWRDRKLASRRRKPSTGCCSLALPLRSPRRGCHRSERRQLTVALAEVPGRAWNLASQRSHRRNRPRRVGGPWCALSWARDSYPIALERARSSNFLIHAEAMRPAKNMAPSRSLTRMCLSS